MPELPPSGPPNPPDDSAPEPWVGREISHYRIAEKIGQGGMGVVYRAIDLILGRPVAIKLLQATKAEHSDQAQRFVQEAKAASALNHPNIVTIYEIANNGEFDYIAMEYVAGSSLHERIHSGQHSGKSPGLPLQEILGYGAQIADALASAHAANIVHRDLKPANIMVTPKGLVKILDFGLAKLIHQWGDAEVTRTMEGHLLTQEGTVLGTAAYMSPEQAEGKVVDWRSDIFSFGIILYEMTTRRRPFQGETAMSTIAAVLDREPQRIHEIAPGIPEELERIVMRCLEKNPEHRIQHLEEVKQALEALQVESMSAHYRAVRQRPQQSARWKTAGIVALGAVLAAAGLLWYRNRPSSLPPAHLTRLTAHSGLTAYPALSPDGRLIAYASDRSGEGNLDIWWQQTGSTEGNFRLTRDEADKYDPSFSSDGTRIVFRSEKEGGGIYVVPTPGGEPRLIARGGRRPRFSPDDKSIAYFAGFVSQNSMIGTTKTYIVPATGGPPREAGAPLLMTRQPVWMPDGRRVLLLGRKDSRESLDWWVVPVNGGPPVRTGAFAQFKAQGLAPPPLDYAIVPETFLPGGNQVLFSATHGDTTNIWQIALHPDTGQVSGKPEQLTFGTELELQSSAARDANGSPMVVFSSQRLNVDVWSVAANHEKGLVTGEFQRLTNSLAYDGWPSATPDGKKLAYVSYEAAHGAIMLHDLETGKETAITGRLTGEMQPKISPDGARVAYTDEATRTGFLIGASGGIAEKLCEGCIQPTSWSNDGSRILFHTKGGMAVMDLRSGKLIDYINWPAHPEYQIFQGHFSPDDRWISFHVRASPTARQIFVAPAGETPPPRDTWVAITGGTGMDRETEWSPTGKLLYFLSDRDGFLCIWGQRLRADKHPEGAAFAVQHFHHARRSIMALGMNPAAIGLSAVKDKFIFSMGELTGNIWLRGQSGQ